MYYIIDLIENIPPSIAFICIRFNLPFSKYEKRMMACLNIVSNI